jgi:hypothetical protein
MNKFPLAGVLMLLAAGCAAPPDPVLARLRQGEAPESLRYDKNPVWTAEIGEALAADRAWKSDTDAFAAIVYFAANAGPEHLPGIEALLAAEKPERCMRGLLVARLSPLDGTRDLLVTHAAKLLDPARPAVARVALGAMAVRRAREATEAIFGYFEAADDPAALRALGRIWEGGSDHPLRTAVHLLVHKLTLSAAATPESAEALLRVMSDVELGEFLSQWAGEKFGARSLIVAAAGAKDFSIPHGEKVHQAFLANPDGELVAAILLTSRHRLDPAAVRALLGDDREGVPEAAAARLDSIESGLRPRLPDDSDGRARLLKKWRERR